MFIEIISFIYSLGAISLSVSFFSGFKLECLQAGTRCKNSVKIMIIYVKYSAVSRPDVYVEFP